MEQIELQETTTDQFDLHLYWQAVTETDISYRVFIHLLDSDGNLITQADGEPQAWQRPTTGWLPTEIIEDPHTLNLPNDLPAGNYTLFIGLYNPQTGQRLVTESGEDGVQLDDYWQR